MKVHKGQRVEITGPENSHYKGLIATAEQSSDTTGWVRVFIDRDGYRYRQPILHTDNLRPL